jgi:hypothetical protein
MAKALQMDPRARARTQNIASFIFIASDLLSLKAFMVILPEVEDLRHGGDGFSRTFPAQMDIHRQPVR